MAERRRLPVLQNDPPPETSEETEEERPPWHWAGFGVVAIFAFWLPLSFAGGAISKRLVTEVTSEAVAQASELERARLMFVVAAPTLLGLVVAAFAGGFVVGRFGTGPGARIGAVSGAGVALLSAILSRSFMTPLVLLASLLVTGALAAGFGALGGRAGAKRRPARGIP